MEHDQSTCLNLNQAFLRYNALGVTRNVRPRARVCLQGHSTQLVKIILLADYQTSYWDPRLASAYAVAATFVLDGATARSYQAAVDTAIRMHGRGAPAQSKRAEMQALCDLIADSRSVCIQLDPAIVDLLCGTSGPLQALDETLKNIKQRAIYSGRCPIIGIKGEFTAEQIGALVRDTLAEGQTTFTEERFACEATVGEHTNWRFEQIKQAA
ncbi:hypothetical protein H8F21_13620 [Pseudomonas sp. P66]|uniref:Uncharacterized protein n=1 Tax=Pseudomonas arcuscaelestis TaxID=2710591 RepID=A0ABS2BZW4_9PSED|nr:hypothetical protein [Pseudomonas arcuscaelestis]MBM5458603.1 hypothetical protein [Pseudomonas arcuscaelestis]